MNLAVFYNLSITASNSVLETRFVFTRGQGTYEFVQEAFARVRPIRIQMLFAIYILFDGFTRVRLTPFTLFTVQTRLSFKYTF